MLDCGYNPYRRYTGGGPARARADDMQQTRVSAAAAQSLGINTSLIRVRGYEAYAIKYSYSYE